MMLSSEYGSELNCLKNNASVDNAASIISLVINCIDYYLQQLCSVCNKEPPEKSE